MKQVVLLLSFLTIGTLGLAQRSSLAMNTETRSEIRVFPNPAAEYFEVQAGSQIRQITVINMVGRAVKTFVYNDKQRYYIADLPRGMYLIQLSDDRGKVMNTQRLNKR